MKTLIVFNHPYEKSYCNAILQTVRKALKNSGQEHDLIDLDRDKFNPVLNSNDLRAFVMASHSPEEAIKQLDAQVIEYKNRIEKAEHLVFIFPIWWMLMPALTKGFIDKVIFPGIAYEYNKEGQIQSILHNLQKVTVISTMNTPSDVYKARYGNAVERGIIAGVFESMGINNCKWINLDMVKQSDDDKRKAWLSNIEKYFTGNNCTKEA